MLPARTWNTLHRAQDTHTTYSVRYTSPGAHPTLPWNGRIRHRPCSAVWVAGMCAMCMGKSTVLRLMWKVVNSVSRPRPSAVAGEWSRYCRSPQSVKPTRVTTWVQIRGVSVAGCAFCLVWFLPLSTRPSSHVHQAWLLARPVQNTSPSPIV
ncbi:hypothetical protein BT67DRAFT_3556 [Trichocladium antarcticum]|uniref:Uncharacterized protein n=1 Tax=Trichocladium antarcticum TaxID=1450529 RepID=A0AAN6US47_9PEZI|nr:hypothetical protein BT67DRAFT_3556 [Trichocladium antarcticum]